MTIRRRSMILFSCAVTSGSGVNGIPGGACGAFGPVMLGQRRGEDMGPVGACDKVEKLRGRRIQHGIDAGITGSAYWTWRQAANRVGVVRVIGNASDIRIQQSL